MSVITEEDLAEAVALMHIPPHKRQVKEVQHLAKLLQWVRLFEDYDETVKEQCCRYMRYAEYGKDDYVFRYGQPGETFYIILQGKVGVLLPTSMVSVSNPQPQNTTRGQLTYTKRRLVLSLLRRASVSLSPGSDELEVAELTPGHSFGELALLQDTPRAASILCKEKTVLAVLRKEHFDSVLKEAETRKLNEKLAVLRSVPALQGWSRLSLSKLTYYLKERYYKRGHVVYSEGDSATEAYIIIDGEFKLTKTISTKRVNVPLSVVVKSSRDIIGEVEVLNDQRRSLTCVCDSPMGRLWVISKGDFLRRMQSAETLNFLHRREERDKRWIQERVGKMTNVEVMKTRVVPELKRIPLRLPDRDVVSLTSRLKRYSNTTPEMQKGTRTCATSRHVTPAGHKRTVSETSAWTRSLSSVIRSKLQVFQRKMQRHRTLSSGKCI